MNNKLLLSVLLIFLSTLGFSQRTESCLGCQNSSANTNQIINLNGEGSSDFIYECPNLKIRYPFLHQVCPNDEEDAIQIDFNYDGVSFNIDAIINAQEIAEVNYPTDAGSRTIRIRVVRDGVVCQESIRERTIDVSCISQCGNCNDDDNYPIVGDVRIGNNSTFVNSNLGNFLASDCDGNMVTASFWENSPNIILKKTDVNANQVWSITAQSVGIPDLIDVISDGGTGYILRSPSKLIRIDQDANIIADIDIVNAPSQTHRDFYTVNKSNGEYYFYYSSNSLGNQMIQFNNQTSGLSSNISLNGGMDTLLKLTATNTVELVDHISPSNIINNLDFSGGNLHVYLFNQNQLVFQTSGQTVVNNIPGETPIVYATYSNDLLSTASNWFSANNVNNNNYFSANYRVLYRNPSNNTTYVYSRDYQGNQGRFVLIIDNAGNVIADIDIDSSAMILNFKRQFVFDNSNQILWTFSDLGGSFNNFEAFNTKFHRILSDGSVTSKILMPDFGPPYTGGESRPFYSRSSESIQHNGSCLYFSGLHKSRSDFLVEDNVLIDGTIIGNSSRLTLLRIQSDLTIKTNSGLESNNVIKSFDIWPNPVSKVKPLNIRIDGQFKNVQFFNSRGDKIKNIKITDRDNFDIDLLNMRLKKGLYFISVTFSDGSIQNKKVLVE